MTDFGKLPYTASKKTTAALSYSVEKARSTDRLNGSSLMHRAAESVAAQQRRCELSKGLVSRARMLYSNSESNREPERARGSQREQESKSERARVSQR